MGTTVGSIYDSKHQLSCIINVYLSETQTSELRNFNTSIQISAYSPESYRRYSLPLLFGGQSTKRWSTRNCFNLWERLTFNKYGVLRPDVSKQEKEAKKQNTARQLAFLNLPPTRLDGST